MVPPFSNRISRVPSYSRTLKIFTYTGLSPLLPTFPCCFSYYFKVTCLIHFRSSLLAESRLMSFPSANEIFQFTEFALYNYIFTIQYLKIRWVFPFGNLRILVYSQLPGAYRSVSRPSSPSSAKASIKCSYII